MIEVLGFVAVLGLLFGAGAQVCFRATTLGSELLRSTRALAAAERLMELRKAGLDPRLAPAELAQGYSAKVREEAFGKTGLKKVTVLVRWDARRSRRRETRLVSLLP